MYSRTFTGRWKTVHANGNSCSKERIVGKFKTMKEANEEALSLWNYLSKQPHANTHMVENDDPQYPFDAFCCVWDNSDTCKIYVQEIYGFKLNLPELRKLMSKEFGYSSKGKSKKKLQKDVHDLLMPATRAFMKLPWEAKKDNFLMTRQEALDKFKELDDKQTAEEAEKKKKKEEEKKEKGNEDNKQKENEDNKQKENEDNKNSMETKNSSNTEKKKRKIEDDDKEQEPQQKKQKIN